LLTFWIGFFHSNFYEFGRNIEPGGSAVRESVILPFDILDEALYEASKLPRLGDIHRKNYVYEKLNMKETQNHILDNSIEFWYGFTTWKFTNAIRMKRIEIIQALFEQAYIANYISNEIGADRHDIIELIEDEIYKDRTSDYKRIRESVLKDKIKQYVAEGYITPSQILSVLPGFINTDAVKHFVRKNLEGWDKLINNYAPREDYWLIIKNLFDQKQEEVELGGTDYSPVQLAQSLGSSTTNRGAAVKYIQRKLKTDMTWSELKMFFRSQRIP